ncbi:MAG: ABC transporter permease [Armatimonadetes bacterium]|nr:ABC transporter permease [Armatimonadota bacterium]
MEDATRSQTLLLVLIGPVLLSMFFSRAFSDRDIRKPELALSDPGRSGLGRLLQSSDVLKIRPVGSLEEGRRLVEEGRAPAALEIPQGFDEGLLGGEFPRIRLIVDDSSRGQVALIREALRGALREQAGQEIPADVRVEKIREFKGGPRVALLPIWVVFTALSGLMVTASTLVEEKENKTLAQVLCAPVSLVDVLTGKVMAGFLLAYVASLLVLVLNGGAPGPAVVALLATGTFLFSALGILVGLFSRGQTAANAATSAIYMLLFVPVAMADFSTIMRVVAGWSPAYYLYDGVFRGLVGQAGVLDLAGHFAILVGTLLAIAMAGVWRLRLQAV